jgi:hypothetical protein
VSVALIDDQILGAVLRGSTPRPLRRRQLATTGYWYVRLCQAVLSAADRPGALLAPFTTLPPQQRERALAALLELPEEIELISLRTLGPVIGHLRQRHNLNALASEALAAAVVLGAAVHLSAPSPLLERALQAEGRTVQRHVRGRG